MSNPIEKVVRDRKIEHLVHFTHLENLGSILKKGIYPRNNIQWAAKFNDTMRLDRHKDAVSLSISLPNYKMFYNIREQCGGSCVVLKINPSIMWQGSCHFCKYNAADGRITKLEEKAKCGEAALSDMFSDTDKHSLNFKYKHSHILNSRKQQKLHDSDTTDPQAEILFFGVVPVDKITAVVFDEDSSMGEYSGERPEHINFEVKKDLFLPRGDVRKGKPYQSKGKDT